MEWGMLRRLIWKELRGERWVAFGLLALAQAVVIPALRLLENTAERGPYEFFGLLLAGGIGLLAARKSATATGKDFVEAHLSVQPVPLWISCSVMPTVLAALIGWWTGTIMGLYVNSVDASIVLMAWAIFFAAVYAVSRFLGAISRLWLAIIVIIVWAISFSTQLPFNYNSAEEIAGLEAMTILNRNLLVAAFFGTFLHTVFFKPRWNRRHSAIVAAVAALIFVFFTTVPDATRTPFLYKWITAKDSSTASPGWDPSTLITSPGMVLRLSTESIDEGQLSVKLYDIREGKDYTRNFAHAAGAIGIVGEEEAYIVQQQPGNHSVEIVAWNWVKDSIRHVVLVKAGRNAITRRSIPWGTIAFVVGLGDQLGFVSEDGRYGLLVLSSATGGGRDLWLINFETEESCIVLPNTWFGARNAVWVGERVLISGYGTAVDINLATKKASIINFPRGAQKQ